MKALSSKHQRLISEHNKNTQELERRLEMKYKASSTRRALSNNSFKGSKELQAKNKTLKRTYKNYLNHMDEMIDKRVENIMEISQK